MFAKKTMLIAAGSLLILAAAPPAAQAKTCLSQAEMGIGHYKLTQGVARSSARIAWRAWVRIHHDRRYDNWTRAEDKRYSCATRRSDGRWRCVVTARPCRR